MFFISKNVAAGIKALRNHGPVARELEAIRAMPGFEVYANAIAEGVGRHGAIEPDSTATPQKPRKQAHGQGISEK